jgi:hypothetical protein
MGDAEQDFVIGPRKPELRRQDRIVAQMGQKSRCGGIHILIQQ